MKTIDRHILTVAAAALLAVSCNLDLYPLTDIVYDEDGMLFTTSAEITEFENGILNAYRSTHYGYYSQADDIMCDGFNATAGYGNNYGSVHRVDASFTPSTYETQYLWNVNYLAIKDYNIVIAAADNVPDALRAEARSVKGEACFFRAAAYLQLVRHFARDYDPATASTDLGVPLVLVYDQAARPARNTVQEVYDRIRADIDSAQVILKDVAGEQRAQYPTIDGVYALKARYFLDTEVPDSAVAYAQKVIRSAAGYALSSTARAMEAEYRNDAGTEPILQLYASLSELPNTNAAYTEASRDDREGVYFAPYYLPSGKLVDAYEASDLRLGTWFSRTMYPTFMNGTYHRSNDFYVFVKFLGNPSLTTGSDDVPRARHSIKPFMLGEMYLIAAEAGLMAGDAAAAKTALNTLQRARNTTQTAATEETVRQEWFRETAGDGLRLSCLKRWGVGYDVRYAQPAALSHNLLMRGANYEEKVLAADDYHLLWPIPSAERQVNPNLVQNPGYSDDAPAETTE